MYGIPPGYVETCAHMTADVDHPRDLANALCIVWSTHDQYVSSAMQDCSQKQLKSRAKAHTTDYIDYIDARHIRKQSGKGDSCDSYLVVRSNLALVVCTRRGKSTMNFAPVTSPEPSNSKVHKGKESKSS